MKKYFMPSVLVEETKFNNVFCLTGSDESGETIVDDSGEGTDGPGFGGVDVKERETTTEGLW